MARAASKIVSSNMQTPTSARSDRAAAALGQADDGPVGEPATPNCSGLETRASRIWELQPILR
jgi:hypothetical protein